MYLATGLSATYLLLARYSPKKTFESPYAQYQLQHELRFRPFSDLVHGVEYVSIENHRHPAARRVEDSLPADNHLALRTDGELLTLARKSLALARNQFKEFCTRAVWDPEAIIPKSGQHLVDQMVYHEVCGHLRSCIEANVMLDKLDRLMVEMRLGDEMNPGRLKLKWSTKEARGMWVVPEVELIDAFSIEQSVR